MSKRPIIEIDRDKCNGCQLCTNACVEGALAMDKENKAYLVKEIYCDGLGACLDVCPTGALKIIEKESDEYDAEKTFQHVKNILGEESAQKVHGVPQENQNKSLVHSCPGALAKDISKGSILSKKSENIILESELTQWPIQLKLISPLAPYFNKIDLLISADCTAFSMGSFHQELLKGKKLIIACPKLDDKTGYIEKLTELIKNNIIYSITVAIMTVPCCSGMVHILEEAIEKSGKNIALKKIVIDLNGKIIN